MWILCREHNTYSLCDWNIEYFSAIPTTHLSKIQSNCYLFVLRTVTDCWTLPPSVTLINCMSYWMPLLLIRTLGIANATLWASCPGNCIKSKFAKLTLQVSIRKCQILNIKLLRDWWKNSDKLRDSRTHRSGCASTTLQYSSRPFWPHVALTAIDALRATLNTEGHNPPSSEFSSDSAASSRRAKM